MTTNVTAEHQSTGVPPAAIVVDGLTKRFGDELAVDHATFEVPAGRVVGFLGPNGAGKSTTMRAIVGLTRPTSGRALIEGVPFADLVDPVRTVGSIVDGVGLHAGRRGIDELRVAAAAAGIERSRCDEVLALVGMSAAGRKRVGQYSLGMRQRLGLALAMLGDPRVLLLDEPANGLDPEGIVWVRQFLRKMADEGRAVFVSSHLLSEVARLADEVVVIHKGKIVATSSVAALTDTSLASVNVASADDERLGRVLIDRGAEVEAEHGGGLVVAGLDAGAIGEIALAEGVALRRLQSSIADLEDVFVALTTDDTAPDGPGEMR